MTLQGDDHEARTRWQDARSHVLARALTVGHSRGRGTLTGKELDKLRDAVADYEQALRDYINA